MKNASLMAIYLLPDLTLARGSLELSEYVKRLAAVYAFFFTFIGGPIAYQTFEPTQQVGLGAAGLGVAVWVYGSHDLTKSGARERGAVAAIAVSVSQCGLRSRGASFAARREMFGRLENACMGWAA